MLLKKKEPIEASHIVVTLKPFKGIPSETYLKFIYGALLAVLLFCFLVLPGIKNYGSKLIVSSSPAGAAVYLSGKRLGTTPLKVFVKAGAYELTVKHPYFLPQSADIAVKGRRIFSLFFPKRLKIQNNLELANLHGMLQNAYEEAADWFAVPEEKGFPRPQRLYEAAKAITQIWEDLQESDKTLISRWAEDLLPLAVDAASFQETAAVWELLRKKGLPLSLQQTIPRQQSENFPSFEQALETWAGAPEADDPPTLNGADQAGLTIGGLAFRYARAGSFTMGDYANFNRNSAYDTFPRRLNISGFYYLEQPLSERAFAAFLSRSNLPDRAPYQRNLSNGAARYVSHSEAKAFCNYLTNLLAANNLPYTARLPYEAEWEFLAKQDLIDIDGFEWMEEAYYRYSPAFYSDKPSFYTLFSPSRRAVRGYSAATGPLPVWQRAFQEASWQTPYLGFRAVLVPIKQN